MNMLGLRGTLEMPKELMNNQFSVRVKSSEDSFLFHKKIRKYQHRNDIKK